MKLCDQCGHNNITSAIFCTNCGKYLYKPTKPGGTRKLETSDLNITAPEEPTGTDTFHSEMVLILDFGRREDRVVISIEDKKEITLGRVDHLTTVVPTINLTELGAWDRGVSRVHAAIRRYGEALSVCDVDSTNGTYLNGIRINRGDWYPLHDGDNLRLGLLSLSVYFDEAGDIL